MPVAHPGKHAITVIAIHRGPVMSFLHRNLTIQAQMQPALISRLSVSVSQPQ